MATNSGTVVTDVLRSVRDESGTGHTRAFALTIISRCQQIVNAILGLVKTTGTITLEDRKLVYNISGEFSDYVSTHSVSYRGEQLDPVRLKELQLIDSDWPRGTSGDPVLFAPIGLDLIVFYPVGENPGSVTVTYVKDTGIIADETVAMSVPDQVVPIVKSFASGILFLRQRDFVAAQDRLQATVTALKTYRNE